MKIPWMMNPEKRKAVLEKMRKEDPTLYGCPLCLSAQVLPGNGNYLCNHGSFTMQLKPIKTMAQMMEGREHTITRAECQTIIGLWSHEIAVAFWKVAAPEIA